MADRFGGRLPFLLKVLAAEQALSIQVHPTREQAEAGYAADNKRGLAPKDPNRNYADDWPKPEVLCALTDFEALAGCRDAEDAAEVLHTLDIPALEPLVRVLRDKPQAQTVSDALRTVLEWPEADRPALLADVVVACRRVATEDGPYAAACDAVVRISADHPGDMGLLCTLLLNHVVLKPGQAVFLAARGLHAYIQGTGIELLANSDNVLRAGLTPKHVDVPELLRVTDPSVPVPVISRCELAPGMWTYETPAPEFRLFRIRLAEAEAPVVIPGTGPRIVLSVHGDVRLTAADGGLNLTQGESCFIPASDGEVTATGSASLFVAAPGV